MTDLNYDNAIGFLFSLQKFGVKLGLGRVENFLGELGDPHKSFRSIHVAGTNGKGSTCVFLESMLRHSGCRVGLYTSPHIIDLTERVVSDGRNIDSGYITRWVSEHRERITNLSLTFFESTTALAFSFFRDTDVEVAICEVGLGGRLDATNVLSPIGIVITGIGIDHQAQLGSSIERIAREKLGIVKSGIPVATGETEPAVLDIFRQTALENGSDLIILDEHAVVETSRCGLDGSVFSYSSSELDLKDLHVNQVGPLQVRNAALAVMCLEVTSGWLGGAEDWIRSGLERVSIPGRFQVIQTERGMVVLDVAHNISAAEALVDSLRTVLPGRKAVVVIGMSSDKDKEGILRTLAPAAREFIVSKPDFYRHERRTTAAELYETAAGLHDRVSEAPSISAAFSRGLEALDQESYLLVTGSFYTVSEVIASMKSGGINS